MSVETPRSQSETKATAETQKKTHHTHFPVLKINLPPTIKESLYEWVDSGVGRVKRVLKIPKK